MPVTRLGNAAITWTATSQGQTERVHLLSSPLDRLRPGADRETFHRQSLDRSAYELVAIGPGAHELSGRVRFDANGQNLMDLLLAGSAGKTLTYVPDLNDPDVSYACDLLSPLVPTGLQLDDGRGLLGEHTVELRLRVTDQAPLDPLYAGSGVLFRLVAGAGTTAATVTRVTASSAPASYPQRGPGGFGTLAIQATSGEDNVLRLGWFSTDSLAGRRTVPALVLEGERTNSLTESEDLSAWAGAADASSGKADPTGGTGAWLVSSTTPSNVLTFTTTVSASTFAVLSLFLKQNSTVALAVQLDESTATGTDWITMEITFDGGTPTDTYTAGTSVGPPERWRDGFYRFQARSTAALSTGIDYRVVILPTNVAGTSGSVFAFGVQLET